MCLDADCLLSNDAVKKAAKYFNNPKVASMISNVKIMPYNNIVNFIQRLEYIVGFYLKKGLNTTNMEYIIGGAGSTFRRTVLEDVGFYDSDTITEDMDLSMKILKEGKQNKIVFGNDVEVWTQGPTNFPDLLKQRYRWKLGWFQTIYKHKSLLFNLNKKFNWQFTLFYLPLMVLAQVLFFFEPLLFGLVIYYTIMAGAWKIIFFLLAFYCILYSFAFLGDDTLSRKNKIIYFLISPLCYFTMLIVSVIEYIASIKVVLNWKKVINYKENKHTTWSHVKRITIK